MTAIHVLPLATADASLEMVGGKGRSLAKMAAAGLPVPAGFHLTTSAYRRFVEENNMRATMLELAKPAISQNTVSFEPAAASIQALFEEAELPAEIITEIRQAYGALSENEPAVAVRSSANAEDLPDLSFAGQHETYLNVRGEEALLAAVRRCWASLWTARALSYRHQMGVDHGDVAMAVVVQKMVPSEVSGILFTANPAMGERSEMIVNASFGLGEAIVGGEITPDTYIIDRETLTVRETIIGSKEHMMVSAAGQGTDTRELSAAEREQSSLAEPVLRELAQLAIAVERHFGQPQDIEWAVVNGTLSLLQSRPITNLPPAPLKEIRWDAPSPVLPGEVLMRRDVVENMPGPLSPLFAELYVQEGLELAADMEKRPIQRRPRHVTVNGYAYVRAGLVGVNPGPRSRLGKIKGKINFYVAYYVKWIPQWRYKGLPDYLACIEQWRQLDPAAASDEQLLSGVRALTIADVIYWVRVRRVMGVSKTLEVPLNNFLRKHAPERGSMMGTGNITTRLVSGQVTTIVGDSGMFIGGFTSKTAQAQADLAAIAKQIRAEEKLYELVVVTPAERLLDTLRKNADGRPVIGEIEHYLDKYGHVVYTLDYAEPTQAEAPLPVLMSLKALVQGTGYDPTARQTESARKREASVKEAIKLFGPLQRWKFRWRVWLARYYGRHREEALFFMGAAWAVLRPLALELGRRLVEVGTLASADDVFYLTREELEEAVQARKEEQALPDYIQKAADQRALREARKRIHPPGKIPPEADESYFTRSLSN